MQLSKVVVFVAVVGAAVGLWQWWTSVDIKGELSRCASSGCFQEAYNSYCIMCSTEYYAGKRVVITGASKGIGRSLGLQLAQLGAK